MESITRYYVSRGIDLGELRPVIGTAKADLAGAIAICPPSSLQDRWTRRFPDPVSAFASGWMRVRARARQRGVELPLVISDHADWDGLTATIAATGASQVWVTHGAEEALVHWCTLKGLEARPLNIVGYGDEEEEDDVSAVAPLAFPPPLRGEGQGGGASDDAPAEPTERPPPLTPPRKGEGNRAARHEPLRRPARPPRL